MSKHEVILLDKKPEVAEGETWPYFNLSVSKAKTFKDCKAKYNFNYIQKLPKKDWEHLSFGKFVHEILERFYKYRINGNLEPDHVLISKSCKEALVEWRPKLSEESLSLSKDMINKFLKKLKHERENHLNPNVIAVEKDFNINIDGKILLLGFIDRVQIDRDGVMCVLDYKTSKSMAYLKKDFLQLQTYAFALFLEYPDVEVIRGSYSMLRHEFEEIKRDFKREDTMKLSQTFYEYYEDIQNEKLFRPKVTPLCGWCDYLDNCKEGKSFMKIPETSHGETGWV